MHSKREDEDTNTESGNDSSKNGAGDGFQHFLDYTLVESDESEFRSEDYAVTIRKTATMRIRTTMIMR